jgi:mannose-6-phosphate isomerase-like protein (cupin superfamily)
MFLSRIFGTKEEASKSWGRIEILKEFSLHQCSVKKLLLKPSAKTSYHYHEKREEHLVVVRGQGILKVDEQLRMLFPGSYFFIPKKSKHSLENTGHEPLVIIETERGECEENDSVKCCVR